MVIIIHVHVCFLVSRIFTVTGKLLTATFQLVMQRRNNVVSTLLQHREVVTLPVLHHTVKKSVDFTVKYLASGCHFFYRYFYGRLPVGHF